MLPLYTGRTDWTGATAMHTASVRHELKQHTGFAAAANHKPAGHQVLYQKCLRCSRDRLHDLSAKHRDTRKSSCGPPALYLYPPKPHWENTREADMVEPEPQLRKQASSGMLQT